MKIKFFKVTILSGKNKKRSFEGFLLPKNINLPFIPRIFLEIKPAKTKIALGNHYHPLSSKRWEVHIILGQKNADLFRLRYKENGKIKEKLLKNGDGIIMPMETSHAFLPLRKHAKIFELSNLSYKPDQSIEDTLF